MPQIWLGTYSIGGEDRDQFAAIADPAAIAAMREPTIERGGYGSGYGGDADSVSRSAYLRQAREEEDRTKARALRMEARQALKRADRLDVLVARLQPVLDMVHAGLRERQREAVEQRDHARAASIDRQIDTVFSEFNKLARNLAQDLAR